MFWGGPENLDFWDFGTPVFDIWGGSFLDFGGGPFSTFGGPDLKFSGFWEVSQNFRILGPFQPNFEIFLKINPKKVRKRGENPKHFQKHSREFYKNKKLASDLLNHKIKFLVLIIKILYMIYKIRHRRF
jgi:hypothetical protein